MAGTRGQPRNLGLLAGVQWQGTPIVELASGLRQRDLRGHAGGGGGAGWRGYRAQGWVRRFGEHRATEGALGGPPVISPFHIQII